MKEDLSLYGNELNYATCSQYPMPVAMQSLVYQDEFKILHPVCVTMIFSRNCSGADDVPPGAWKSAGLSGMDSGKSGDPDMYLPRFLVAMFETGHYPAKAGIRKQSSLDALQSSTAQQQLDLCSVHTSIPALLTASTIWLLFIVDAIISVAVIIPQTFFFLDIPARQKPGYVFNEADVELARDRNPKERRVNQGAFTNAQCVSLNFQDLRGPEFSLVPSKYWHFPGQKMVAGSRDMASLVDLCNSEAGLRIDNYTTPIQATVVVLILFMTWRSDTWLKGRRWPMLILGSVVNGAVCVILGATPIWKSGYESLRISGLEGLSEYFCGNYTIAAGLLYLMALTALGLAYLQHQKGNRLSGDGKEDSSENEPISRSVDGNGLGKVAVDVGLRGERTLNSRDGGRDDRTSVTDSVGPVSARVR
ncbi:uncharacterized protein PAC_07095 [Phialocephala subalpina]|uniref:Uncharacterized protein n=1 Tax=Phialocephala subalpina TaxID=576137 RepID=A0A1L7WWQ9_9HELO|nr:uncharacterized protein PAC_07095 [Phialocephala subalpina]